jgi:sugar lactone lactonase YvrE
MSHGWSLWAAGAALAGFVIAGLLVPLGYGQNAAQRAALAKLGRAQAKISSLNAPASGVEATSVPLYQPSGLAFDTAGNLYIADTNENVIREVNLVGVISTVAGTGEQGYGGDGGSATAALLDTPIGVAVDAAGNIYIGDSHNNRVREVVASSGYIVTLAGTGVAGFSGDGAAASLALLNLPTAVAVDSNGNVYMADTNNHRIREIVGTTINTVAGNGEQTYSGDGGLATAASLDSPSGVAVDGSFNFYICDTDNQRLRMVTHSTGFISTIAGTGAKGFTADGAVSSAALARPVGIAVDASGTVYFADADNHRIRTVAGGVVTTIAGTGLQGFGGDSGASTSASLDTPLAVAVYSGNVAFADSANNRVRLIDAGTVDTKAGLASPKAESILVSGPLTTVYGTGTLTATFSNGGNTGTGVVTFYDGLGASSTVVGTANLSGNAASISTSQLSAGMHNLVASYPGDAQNAATTSGVYVLVVTPVALTAVANPVNLLYGQTIPTLTGSLNTVLAQDTGNVVANFATTATSTSDPATYAISVTISGSAANNYTVAIGGTSGSVVIAKAPSRSTLTSNTGIPILGTSLALTATVSSTTSGTPRGTVTFYDGATLLNTAGAIVSNGVAALNISTLAVGAHSITAVYSGSTDYITSTSSALTENVLSPDFTITASPSSQTILPSYSANYTLTLTPVNPTFVYPVSLSVSGLPAGVTASFAPSSIAVGAGASTSVLTLTASVNAELRKTGQPFAGAAVPTVLAFLMLPLVFTRRARLIRKRLSHAAWMMIAVLALVAMSTLTGCGGGGFFSHATNTYTVTVTAVSGPDTHTTDVTLTVQ